MTSDVIRGYLEATLRRLGFVFVWENGLAAMTAGLGGRRWKMAILCFEDRFAFYAAYPKQVPHDGRAKMLEYLNAINAESALGGYFLLETEEGLIPVCRCDVIIPGEFSIPECIERGLKLISAEIYSKWEKLQDAVRMNDR